MPPWNQAGYLVFETRRPQRRAWQDWAADTGEIRLDIPGSAVVTRRHEATQVQLPFVSFRYTYTFLSDGTVLTSGSTLRFRDHDELTSDLAHNGYRVLHLRDAPDRPGHEFVFIAERTTAVGERTRQPTGASFALPSRHAEDHRSSARSLQQPPK